jgi:hypothetical protein
MVLDAKRGRPKGRLDGPRPSGAPKRGRPKKKTAEEDGTYFWPTFAVDDILTSFSPQMALEPYSDGWRR